ncbi:MAG: helix-turn-helix domain-containing protein [Streptosporangiales bacterium]|nr:helix-turn-helix domain-containing protein [Streptosporangiales bacterium]
MGKITDPGVGEPLLSAAEVAARLGVTIDTVTRWCRRGHLRASKPGRDWRVPASALEEFLTYHVPAPDGAGATDGPATTDDEPASTGDELTRLIDTLPPGGHVLVAVPGDAEAAGEVHARLAAVADHDLQPPSTQHDPILARALLTAAQRAELDLLTSEPAPHRRFRLLRWAVQHPHAATTERRLTHLAAQRGLVVLCVLPLAEVAGFETLLQVHTHLLVAAPTPAASLTDLGDDRAEATG